jgi:hypothetical protein
VYWRFSARMVISTRPQFTASAIKRCCVGHQLFCPRVKSKRDLYGLIVNGVPFGNPQDCLVPNNANESLFGYHIISTLRTLSVTWLDPVLSKNAEYNVYSKCPISPISPGLDNAFCGKYISGRQ